MSRIVRDNLVGIIVAVIAALMVSLITIFTTNLTRMQDVGVFGLSLVACVLMLALVYVPGVVRRRRERRRSALRAEIMAELRGAAEGAITPTPGSTATTVSADDAIRGTGISGGVDSTNAAVRPSKAPPREGSLRELLIEGRNLQAKCRGIESSYIIPDELAVEIGQWDGRAGAALLNDTDLLNLFRSEPWAGEVFHLSAREVYRMLDVKLGALESAIRKTESGRGKRR